MRSWPAERSATSSAELGAFARARPDLSIGVLREEIDRSLAAIGRPSRPRLDEISHA